MATGTRPSVITQQNMLQESNKQLEQQSGGAQPVDTAGHNRPHLARDRACFSASRLGYHRFPAGSDRQPAYLS